jgi:sugar/nucleoside kinase (ribokinase family)
MNRGIALGGSLIVDVIKDVDAFPQAGKLSTITKIAQSTGGLVCNCALDLMKLDRLMHVAAIGFVGADAYGEIIRRSLREGGVDISHITSHSSLGTSFTDVINQRGGKERTFLQHKGCCAALDVDDIPLSDISADILHMGYLMLLDALDADDEEYGTRMARLLAKAQSMGFLTSIDVVSEDSDRFARIVPPALKHTDYCIINEIEASSIVGIQARSDDGGLIYKNIPKSLTRLRAYGVKRWVVIHCPEGGFALDENDRYIMAPAYLLPDCVIKGKTGAGDAFCAATLYAAYEEASLESALRLANAAAAASLTEPGASDGLMDAEALMGWVKQWPRREIAL